jgi:hypothetical protein
MAEALEPAATAFATDGTACVLTSPAAKSPGTLVWNIASTVTPAARSRSTSSASSSAGPSASRVTSSLQKRSKSARRTPVEPGEAVEFATWTPHWLGAVDGPVELIMIVGPEGERLHLHA